jgi:Beta-lactamase enzyme family
MPAAIGRRRLLVGAGAAAGLAALGGCDSTATDGRPVTPGTAGAASPASPSATAPSASSTSTPTPTPTRSAGVTTSTASSVEAPRLTERIDRYLAGRRGTLGLELVDLRRGESFRYEAEEGYCYSTIKVLILTTLLRQLQEDGADLGARQRRLAERMITRSDNAATEALLAEVGRDEVTRVAALVGMERTEIGSGWWGHWRTVPGDLNLMVDAVLSSDRVLDGSRRTVARFLMAEVVPAQRWGVFAPESSTVHVAAKNGWGPLPDGYRVNSSGWVQGTDREYVLSVLASSPRGFTYGRRTVSGVVKLCHAAVAEGLA